MVGYIYKITNKKTHQNYIGQTIDINRRKRTHFNRLRKGIHDNPKIQASWNKYGEDSFDFEYWEFQISCEQELNELECKYIEIYNGLDQGFNLIPGGGKPPLRQKIKDDDAVTFLCVLQLLGDGYGKTCEAIFGWSKGTASAIKRGTRYLNGRKIYEEMSESERWERGEDFIASQHLKENALSRQAAQGGSEKAYSLTQEDYNFAFAAQELGYGYTPVAIYFGIKPSTVKDWFNQRSRKKERQVYNELNDETKRDIKKQVKAEHLEAVGHDRLLNKKEEDLISFLCYDEFFEQKDSSIQKLFNWSEGTCHGIRESSHYPITKAKTKLLAAEERKKIATHLKNRL